MSAVNSRAERNQEAERAIVDFAARVNFEIAKEEVKRTDYAVSEIKELTFDIMDKVSNNGNVSLMNTIARNVRNWKKDKTIEWKSSLNAYARSREDIVNIYVGKNTTGNEVIIVADDVVSEQVLEHNEFCFELLDTHADIVNFMVLDQEEYECMSIEFEGYKKIYQRG